MSKSFALFATQRSGTTALRACLNSCPRIHMFGEAFYPGVFDWGFYRYYADRVAGNAENILPERRLDAYADYARKLQADAPDKSVGFDVKYSDIDSNPGMIGALSRTVDVAIHLRRQNLLKTHVSNLTMKKRVKEKVIQESEIHSKSVAPLVKVFVEPKSIVSVIDQRMNAILRYEAQLKASFSKVVQLNYEDVFEQSDDRTLVESRARAKILSALGITWDQPLSCELKKQNPTRLEDLVENFGDVAEAVNSSRYFYMLEDRF